MGFYFRKALGFGPLRVNLSKSGVGFSVGVTGARIGINPRGQAYVHAGRGGFYVRQNLGGPTPTHEPSPPPPHVAPNVTAFESTDAAQLSDASLADILAAFERVRRRTSRVSLVVFAALVVFAIGAGAAQLRIVELPDFAWIIAAVGVAAASAVALSRASDIDKRDGVVRLTLNLEPAVEESVTEFHKALTELRRCDRAWLVSTSERTGDWKRNAGAISLVSRTVVTPSEELPRGVQCNKPVVCLPAGRQTLYFFPFGLLVYDSTGIGAIPYDKLNVRSGNTSFREVDSVPGDATVVGHTWRYVNKNGGPDRRFSNNAQLPILNYGVLNLTSDSGLNEMFQTSRASAATAVEAAVHAMPQITFAIRRTP